jgi:hypothetical protein
MMTSYTTLLPYFRTESFTEEMKVLVLRLLTLAFLQYGVLQIMGRTDSLSLLHREDPCGEDPQHPWMLNTR